jgi:hypothetical protein
MPGDNVTMGEEGQSYGILTGGTFFAKASNLCQLFLTKARETMVLVTRRFRIFTDFGEITSTSEAGNASLNIRGNTAVQQSNRKPSDYEINIRLGGKDFLNAELGERFRAVVQKNGQLEINTENLFLITDKTANITASEGLNLASEDFGTITIANGMSYEVTGPETRTNFGALTSSITGTYTQTVSKVVRLTHNATIEHNISGISVDELVNNAAYAVNVGRGDVVFDIGDPSAGGFPTGATAPYNGSFVVNLTSGEFNVGTLFGDINIQTVLGQLNLTSFLGTTLSSLAITEISGTLVKLDAQLRSLNGDGASDSVVTALRLT